MRVVRVAVPKPLLCQPIPFSESTKQIFVFCTDRFLQSYAYAGVGGLPKIPVHCKGVLKVFKGFCFVSFCSLLLFYDPPEVQRQEFGPEKSVTGTIK
jgi:hypothetical protein